MYCLGSLGTDYIIFRNLEIFQKTILKVKFLWREMKNLVEYYRMFYFSKWNLQNYLTNQYTCIKATKVLWYHMTILNEIIQVFLDFNLWICYLKMVFESIKVWRHYISPKVRFGHPLQDFTFKPHWGGTSRKLFCEQVNVNLKEYFKYILSMLEEYFLTIFFNMDKIYFWQILIFSISLKFPRGSVDVTIIKVTQWKVNDAISILIVDIHCNYAMAYNFIIYDKINTKRGCNKLYSK
jgi:hypothetical protein